MGWLFTYFLNWWNYPSIWCEINDKGFCELIEKIVFVSQKTQFFFLKKCEIIDLVKRIGIYRWLKKPRKHLQGWNKRINSYEFRVQLRTNLFSNPPTYDQPCNGAKWFCYASPGLWPLLLALLCETQSCVSVHFSPFTGCIYARLEYHFEQDHIHALEIVYAYKMQRF